MWCDWFHLIWFDRIWLQKNGLGALRSDMTWHDEIWYGDLVWNHMTWEHVKWCDEMRWCAMICWNMMWYDGIWWNTLKYDEICHESENARADALPMVFTIGACGNNGVDHWADLINLACVSRFIVTAQDITRNTGGRFVFRSWNCGPSLFRLYRIRSLQVDTRY